MNIKKNYTKTEVLAAGRIGFEFEFYSSFDVIKTAKELAKEAIRRYSNDNITVILMLLPSGSNFRCINQSNPRRNSHNLLEPKI
jgi:hypothetical protein